MATSIAPPLEHQRSRMYAFVRGRQLEGTFPGSPQTGVWILSDRRIVKGWGAPPESAWPYDGDASHWPPNEPAGIDALAKELRAFAYGRVRTLDHCRELLSSEHTFVASFAIDDTWYTTRDGRVGSPRASQPKGSHSVLIVGYDDNERRLKFANSWGEDWGDAGYGYLPYDYWTDRLLESWYVDYERPRPASADSSGIVFRSVGVRDLLDRVLHMTEIDDRVNDELIGWSLVVEGAESLEIEDLFVRPRFRGSGYGRELCKEVNDLAARIALPLVYWIPHVDWAGAPSPAQTAVLGRLGLTPAPTRERWAAMLAARAQ